MWVMVMFDLPVVSAEDRKQSTDFRNRLLDLGFEMVQFSVYARRAGSMSRSGGYIHEIEEAIPDHCEEDEAKKNSRWKRIMLYSVIGWMHASSPISFGEARPRAA